MTYCSDLTRERILECAKAEFLAKGYRAAQLKSIASAAQVTTGAIYRHFKDKNDLFLTLVKEVSEFTVARLDRDGCDAAGIQKALDSDSVEQTYAQVMDYIDYMYEHCDEFRLLLKCAQGSSAEDFTETISERYAAQNMAKRDRSAYADAWIYKRGMRMHRPRHPLRTSEGLHKEHRNVPSLRVVRHSWLVREVMVSLFSVRYG